MDYKMPSFSLGKWNTIVDNFYEKYYGLKKWHDSQVNNVRKNKGWIANPSGRRFKFTKHAGSAGLDYSRPQILNYPVQSFATADIMSLAMVVIDRRIRKAGYNAEIVNQIHDDILYDATEEDAPKVAKCMAQVMDELPQLIFKQYGIRFNTRLGGEAKTGLNWKNMEKMKND